MRNRNDQGLTLMEIMVVVTIILVVLTAGMRTFYQSLRSGSKVDLELLLEGAGQITKESISRLVSYGQIEAVGGFDKADCVDAGASGVTGTSLVVNKDGGQTTYSLSDGVISSVSAVTVRVNPEGMDVGTLSFSWYCQAGEREKVRVRYTGTAVRDGQTTTTEKEFDFWVLVKNSGYY